MPKVDETFLRGTWLHSHEEDRPGETVYRRESHPFPPSRGRSGFALTADGTCEEIGIAAADGPSKRRATWRVGSPPGDALLIESEGSSRRMRILRLEPDLLVVAKPQVG